VRAPRGVVAFATGVFAVFYGFAEILFLSCLLLAALLYLWHRQLSNKKMRDF
jgi:hypothetical protein